MAKYKWRVGLLAEFFPKVIDFIHYVQHRKSDRPPLPTPQTLKSIYVHDDRFNSTPTLTHTSTHTPRKTQKNPGLLGLNYNRGQKILVRLRPHDNPGSFLAMESILGCVNAWVGGIFYGCTPMF